MSNKIDFELIALVHDDLKHLEAVAAPPIAAATPRRIAGDLRRLCLDGMINRAWRMTGFEKEPKIIAEKMREELMTPAAFVVTGAKTNSMVIGPTTYQHGAMSDEKLRDMAVSWRKYEHFEFRFSEFLESTALYSEDRKISRRQVIQYVANKLGGVHYDVLRTRKQDRESFLILDRARAGGLVFGGFVMGDSDIIEEGFGIASMVIIGVAQAISSSPDIEALLQRCAQLLERQVTRKPL